MDDNFRSEINMEENPHHYKPQPEDYQVFFSTIQINEFDKKINHNNLLEFPECQEHSFPTNNKLDCSNAIIDTMELLEKKKILNKTENLQNKNFEYTKYPDFSQKEDNSFCFNSNNDEEKFTELEFQCNFENFNNITVDNEKKVSNTEYKNFVTNITPSQESYGIGSNKKIQYTSPNIYSIDDISNYIIKEKEEKKDLIGSHKIYEIFFQDTSNEMSLKCYRRYDNFYKFYLKLLNEYPFVLIPRLPCKNPLTKILKIEQEFYDSRKNQLNYFLNFIKKNDHLYQGPDFRKFISNAEFDEEHFSIYSNKLRKFPCALKVSETLKNKIFGVFSTFFGNRETKRIQSNEERYIKKLEIHYKTICEKYIEVKENMAVYLKSISKCSQGYRYISNTLLYIRDNLSNPDLNAEIFNSYSILSGDFSEINKDNFEKSGKIIESKFENFLNVLQGLCDLFDRFNNFIGTFESVAWAKSYSFDNNLREIEEISKEYNEALNLKETFEKNIIEEVNVFDKNYSNNYNQIISEFVEFVKKVNYEELERVNQMKEINC